MTWSLPALIRTDAIAGIVAGLVLFFVLIDGWNLVVRSIIGSIH